MHAELALHVAIRQHDEPGGLALEILPPRSGSRFSNATVMGAEPVTTRHSRWFSASRSKVLRRIGRLPTKVTKTRPVALTVVVLVMRSSSSAPARRRNHRIGGRREGGGIRQREQQRRRAHRDRGRAGERAAASRCERRPAAATVPLGPAAAAARAGVVVAGHDAARPSADRCRSCRIAVAAPAARTRELRTRGAGPARSD